MNKIAEFEKAEIDALEYENNVLDGMGPGIHDGPLEAYLNEASGHIGDRLSELQMHSSKLFNEVVEEFGNEIACAALYRAMRRAGRHVYLLPDGSGVRSAT